MTEKLLKMVGRRKSGDRIMFFRQINEGERIEAVWSRIYNEDCAEEFSPRAQLLNRSDLEGENLLTIAEAAKKYDMNGNLKGEKAV